MSNAVQTVVRQAVVLQDRMDDQPQVGGLAHCNLSESCACDHRLGGVLRESPVLLRELTKKEPRAFAGDNLAAMNAGFT